MIKRLSDIALATVLLCLLGPIMICTAFVNWLAIGRPVVFSQMRTGQHGRLFKMSKFRTMTDECDEYGRLLPDENRLTRLGDWLRKTSMDELPELFSVLKGDMSLVGPRPLLPEYLPLYTPRQARRHEVKPGITGWAQVNGRNSLSWEERFELDLWYVENRSLALDLKILGLTVLRVLTREGISKEGYATMPPFTGKQDHKS